MNSAASATAVKLSSIETQIGHLRDRVLAYFVDNPPSSELFQRSNCHELLDKELNHFISSEIAKLEQELSNAVKTVTNGKKKKRNNVGNLTGYDDESGTSTNSSAVPSPLFHRKQLPSTAQLQQNNEPCQTDDSSSVSSTNVNKKFVIMEPPTSWSLTEKSLYKCLVGQVYNIYPTPTKEAYECFGTALKLNPENAAAWNGLGEFYWKAGDYDSARACFEAGLEWKSSAGAYWRLALVYRQLKGSPQDCQENLDKSITYSKKAIIIDPNDPEAWLALGTGYLKLFFNYSHLKSDIQKALNAYTRAERCDPEMLLFDIYHSVGVAHDFLENFDEASKYFKRACRLDPRNQNAFRRLLSVETYVAKMFEVASKRCFLKQKRISAEVEELIKNLKPGEISDIEMIDPTKPFKCRILYDMAFEDRTRRCFMAVDSKSNLFGFTVYNLVSTASTIREFVNIVITRPEVVRIQSPHDKSLKMKSIRVEDAKTLLVKGIPVPGSEIVEMFIATKSH